MFFVFVQGGDTGSGIVVRREGGGEMVVEMAVGVVGEMVAEEEAGDAGVSSL